MIVTLQMNMERFQEVGVVNHVSPKEQFTRVTEYKHLTGQKSATTTISYEYPQLHGEPYYPIPTEGSKSLYKKYLSESKKLTKVMLAGRLATFQYYNMDQVVANSLELFKIINRK